jgi:hypothetical protein
MQTAVTGQGLRVMGFSLLALLLIGLAGFVAGIRQFRWDAEQRFAQRSGKGWVAMAIVAWAAVGLLAESRGRIGPIDIVPEYGDAALAATNDNRGGDVLLVFVGAIVNHDNGCP